MDQQQQTEEVKKISMADLDQPERIPFQPVEGAPKDLNEEAQKQKADDETGKTDDKPTPAATTETKAEETKPEGEEEEDKVDAAPAGTETDEDPLEFFKEVDRVRGMSVAVEYGDVSPNSLEGIVLRERAIEQQAIQRYQADLTQTMPRVAAYQLHIQRGGTDEEFFGRKNLALPEYEMFKNDVGLQKQIYKNDLLRKGLGEDEVEALIGIAEKSNKLAAEADKAYKAQEQRDKDELARLTQLAEEDTRNYQQKVAELGTLLDTAIKSPAMNVVIPDSEQKGFRDFVNEMLQTDGKEFYLAQPLKKETIDAVMAAMYLQFKKGDLSKIVERKARTLNVAKNSQKLDSSKKTVATAEQVTKKTVTLGEQRW